MIDDDITLLRMDSPTSYFCRIRRTNALSYPTSDDEYIARMVSLLELAVNGKLILEQSYKICSKTRVPVAAKGNSNSFILMPIFLPAHKINNKRKREWILSLLLLLHLIHSFFIPSSLFSFSHLLHFLLTLFYQLVTSASHPPIAILPTISASRRLNLFFVPFFRFSLLTMILLLIWLKWILLSCWVLLLNLIPRLIFSSIMLVSRYPDSFFNYSPGDDSIPIIEIPSTGKVLCICEDKYQAKYYFAFQNWMNLAITFSLPLVLFFRNCFLRRTSYVCSKVLILVVWLLITQLFLLTMPSMLLWFLCSTFWSNLAYAWLCVCFCLCLFSYSVNVISFSIYLFS